MSPLFETFKIVPSLTLNSVALKQFYDPSHGMKTLHCISFLLKAAVFASSLFYGLQNPLRVQRVGEFYHGEGFCISIESLSLILMLRKFHTVEKTPFAEAGNQLTIAYKFPGLSPFSFHKTEAAPLLF